VTNYEIRIGNVFFNKHHLNKIVCVSHEYVGAGRYNVIFNLENGTKIFNDSYLCGEQAREMSRQLVEKHFELSNHIDNERKR
jgi:hypothetical protein